jgi:hypothetical protein
VCVCGCTKTGKPVFLCVFSLFLYIFLQLWKSRGIIEKSQVIIVCIAQHPVDTYARRLQTSPNAYVIYLYSPNKQTNKACQYRYPVAPGFCLVSNNQKLVSTGILRVTKKWKIFGFSIIYRLHHHFPSTERPSYYFSFCLFDVYMRALPSSSL